MFNSLKIKIVGIVSIIVIAIIAISAWINYSNQKKMLETISRQNSLVLIDSILSSIQTSMKLGHSKDIDNILGKIQSRSYIKALRIVDANGKILHSADPLQIGALLSPEERQALKSETRDSFNVAGEKDIFDSYTRIKNGPECNGCHPSSIKTIAFLEAELSLSSYLQFIHKEQHNNLISTIVIIALIIGTLFLFLSHYVDQPIRQLIKSMRSMESGNFDTSLTIKSSNEMSLLSQHLGIMGTRLKEMMAATVNHERELARAQEKLAHHQETHQMNKQLEGQLKEIENLNLSLEERIEEIEHANYTIADLAGELEQKNTNLEKAVERLSTLYKVGLAINSTIDIDRLFNLIVRTISTTLNASIGYIILYDPKDQLLNVTNLIGNGKMLAPRKAIPMKDSGVSAWVIRNRQPILIKDINQTPQFDRFSDLGYERKTLICAPLMLKDEIIGTISVINKNDNTQFTNDEMDMLSTIAAQASIAIKNATLYDEQQQTYLNTIQALVSAIEASDSYTRGHSERVTRYSLELGKRMNLPQNRLQILERAAILHDIGKIGVDLSLLHKEGKLTPGDIRELQQHPAIGMHILEPISFLQEVRVCIGQHHERYDGMGYPNRIKKEEQLLESRILSVADSFDAMTTDRPYRKGLSLESAIQELQDNSGTQFDPDIVSIFTQLVEEGTFFNPHFPFRPQTILNSTEYQQHNA